MKIPYPNEKEKRQSIDFILGAGLEKPKNIPEQISEVFQRVGLKYLFQSSYLMIALATLLFLIGYLCLLKTVPNKTSVSLMMTCFAPLLYLVITSLNEYFASTSPLAAIEATCKYPLRKLNALRQVILSLYGLFFVLLMQVLPFLLGIAPFELRALGNCLTLYLGLNVCQLSVAAKRGSYTWLLSLCYALFALWLIYASPTLFLNAIHSLHISILIMLNLLLLILAYRALVRLFMTQKEGFNHAHSHIN